MEQTVTMDNLKQLKRTRRALAGKLANMNDARST